MDLAMGIGLFVGAKGSKGRHGGREFPVVHFCLGPWLNVGKCKEKVEESKRGPNNNSIPIYTSGTTVGS